MKVLKSVLIVIGLLAVAGAAGLLVKNAWDLRVLYEVAMANKSQPSVTDPTSLVLIGAGLAAVAGLVLGLGIGLPRRTAGAVRHDTLEELNRRTAADAAASPTTDSGSAARAGTTPSGTSAAAGGTAGASPDLPATGATAPSPDSRA